ncbi:MAG: helix-turn-helix transcriptional regulator [Candidatus Omnitrophica bacterium]|nr:helix-turn-helix transcriptional regulator [Candidatus Omnitrophota bacterium]
MKIAKYFWDLNERALKEVPGILRNPGHFQFNQRVVSILSRCDKPKEVFSVISKKRFIKSWPAIKTYWVRIERRSEFRDWWQTIYEQLLEKQGIKQMPPKGEPSFSLKEIGALIRRERINKGLSQQELSLLTRVKQPEISKIEEGKKNITLVTLIRLCRALNIQQVNFKK